MAEQQAKLGKQHRPSVPGSPKQTVLPAEAAIIQHLQETPVDVLPVCGRPRSFLRCGVLRGAAYLTDSSRLDQLIRRAGSVVGMKLDSGDCGREENIQQTARYPGQCQPSSAHCHQQPQELGQRQDAPHAYADTK